MDFIDSLQEFGLNKNESLVYLELLPLGRTNVGPLVAATGLHRQIVYTALDQLEASGLVSSVVRNNRKAFLATPPAEFLRIVDEKKRIADKLVPNLAKLQAQSSDPLEVKVLYGERGLIDHLKRSLDLAEDSNRIVSILTGNNASCFWDIISSYKEEYLEESKKRKIQKHLIADETYPDWAIENIFQTGRNQLKILSPGLNTSITTRIVKGMVAIEIYEPEPCIIQISSLAVAKSYQSQFAALWKQAKAISRA